MQYELTHVASITDLAWICVIELKNGHYLTLDQYTLIYRDSLTTIGNTNQVANVIRVNDIDESLLVKIPNKPSKYVDQAWSENTGGHCMVDVIELVDGTYLTIDDESVVYRQDLTDWYEGIIEPDRTVIIFNKF